MAESVRSGLMVPFSYPEGNTDYRQNVVEAYNNGIWPADQNEWDSLYEDTHQHIQKDSRRLATHMGENCSFVINAGQAIYNVRADKALSKFGYKLQRTQGSMFTGRWARNRLKTVSEDCRRP